MPPPLDPRGEIVSIVGEAGQAGVILRGRRPKEDAIRRRDRLRRIYAAYLRECIEGWDIPPSWRGEEGNWHWRLFRAGYLAGQAGAGEDVALEDHEAWTERVMALPDGERPRILNTEEGPMPVLPGTIFLTWPRGADTRFECHRRRRARGRGTGHGRHEGLSAATDNKRG